MTDAPPRIRLVGQFAIERGEARVEAGVLAAVRSRRIIAALVINGNGLGARRLAERVWEEPPATWPNALRGAIASLRAALAPIGLDGQRVVVTTPSGWALDASVTTDLAEAEGIVAAAEAELESGGFGAGLALPGRLASILGGRVLAGDEAEWLEPLRATHLRLVERIRVCSAEAALLAGRPQLALDAADELLALSAVDERAYRIRIRARMLAGDRAGAIDCFEQCREVLAEELGIDPSAETSALYLEVLRSGSSGSGTLPVLPVGGFFGRAAEIRSIIDACAGPGIIEVLGRGGVGKSRLVLQAAHELGALASGGRYWAGLGDLVADELVAVTVAEAVGVGGAPHPVEAVIEQLAPLGPTLLVLDGCEGVIDGVVELALALREAVPGLRLLLSSRQPTGLTNQTRVELAPLPTPDSADVARSAAVQLLADRVAARGGRLRLDAASAAHLRELCERCEGVPLALELAAGQLASMAVGDLLDALAGGGGLVTDVLAQLLGQGLDALEADERTVFEALVLVDGRVPLPLVRAMVEGRARAGRVPRLLSELDGAGLVVVERASSRWRYGVDDELRRLARAELGSTATAALAGLAAGLDQVAPDDPRVPPAPYREAVDAASDGFRTLFAAAIRGEADHPAALRLAFRLHRYWTVTRIAEGRYWLRELLAGAAPGADRALATFAAGYLGYWAGDADALLMLRRAGAELERNEPGYAARALTFAAGLADDLDEAERSMEDMRAALRLARLDGAPSLILSAQLGVAAILAERGDQTALGAIAEAFTALGDDVAVDQRLAVAANAARLAWQLGSESDARRYVAIALPLLEGPARIAKLHVLCSLAGTELAWGDLDSAAEYARLAVECARELGVDRELPLALALGARVAVARGESAAAASLAESLLAAVAGLPIRWPSALALETATVALAASGGSDAIPALLATAAAIRAAGDRPAAATLRIPLDSSVAALGIDEAIVLAREGLRDG